MTHHVIPPRVYLIIFAALIGLTVATVAVATVDLPEWAHLWIGLAIATAKAVLVVLFFMHVLYSTRLTWLVASGALMWLVILMAYTLTDYLSRRWTGVPGH